MWSCEIHRAEVEARGRRLREAAERGGAPDHVSPFLPTPTAPRLRGPPARVPKQAYEDNLPSRHRGRLPQHPLDRHGAPLPGHVFSGDGSEAVRLREHPRPPDGRPAMRHGSVFHHHGRRHGPRKVAPSDPRQRREPQALAGSAPKRLEYQPECSASKATPPSPISRVLLATSPAEYPRSARPSGTPQALGSRRPASSGARVRAMRKRLGLHGAERDQAPPDAFGAPAERSGERFLARSARAGRWTRESFTCSNGPVAALTSLMISSGPLTRTASLSEARAARRRRIRRSRKQDSFALPSSGSLGLSRFRPTTTSPGPCRP